MKKRKTVLLLLLLLFCGIFIYCGTMLVIEFSQRERDDETFDELAELILLPDEFVESSASNDFSYSENSKADESYSEESGSEQKPQIYHKRNLSPIIEKNSDCVGWIYIEDTHVNYPVMYTPNEAQKYIDKSFDLKSSSYGVPFIEGECTPNGDHVIIYGHNMKNGSMFATIKQYRNKDFFDSHPIIEYETLDGCKTYRVLAMCEINSKDKWYSFMDTGNPIDFDAQFSRVLKRAVNKSDVVPTQDKQILTLSTCQGGDKDARLVLIAIEE